jgi:hypothetical protein
VGGERLLGAVLGWDWQKTTFFATAAPARPDPCDGGGPGMAVGACRGRAAGAASCRAAAPEQTTQLRVRVLGIPLQPLALPASPALLQQQPAPSTSAAAPQQQQEVAAVAVGLHTYICRRLPSLAWRQVHSSSKRWYQKHCVRRRCSSSTLRLAGSGSRETCLV